MKDRLKNLKSHFSFNKQERNGIFFLLLIIVLLQVGYFVLKSFPKEQSDESFLADTEMQAQIDLLKENALQQDTLKIYPFNPNYISDYKGYVLGMAVDEIDNLHAFRAQNKYVNSSEEFQKVTGVSDSLLQVISPYFKFPEWTKFSNSSKVGASVFSGNDEQVKVIKSSASQHTSNENGREQDTRVGGNISDLNTATALDLKEVNGIGDVLSARIVKFRDRLGGFLIDEQLYDVYGLEPDVAKRALNRFRVVQKPEIQKININTASSRELSKLVYLQKRVAERIVNYRKANGTIGSFDELTNIEEFPSDKIERIQLYLSL